MTLYMHMYNVHEHDWFFRWLVLIDFSNKIYSANEAGMVGGWSYFSPPYDKLDMKIEILIKRKKYTIDYCKVQIHTMLWVASNADHWLAICEFHWLHWLYMNMTVFSLLMLIDFSNKVYCANVAGTVGVIFQSIYRFKTWKLKS